MINFPDAVAPQSSQKGDEANKPVTPFPDLRSAGRKLALHLANYREAEDVLVLAIVLGGVLVAHEVATQLGLPLDLLIIRRLLAPQGAESQICAVNVCGSLVIDERLMPRPAEPLRRLNTLSLTPLPT